MLAPAPRPELSRLTRFCRRIDACRSCAGTSLSSVIDLGEPYISDFVDKQTVGIRAPLRYVQCGACGLVQMDCDIDRDLLFRDHYWYRSATNQSMLTDLDDVVRDIERDIAFGPTDRVLDIGSNDGSLLRRFKELSAWQLFGVEPSPVAAPIDDYFVYRDFWPDCSHYWSASQSSRRFRVITTIACFYATQEPNAFVAAIKRYLAADGLWVIQLQDAQTVREQMDLDYFCHEHTCLWDMNSLSGLLTRHGLEIAHVTRHPVNGGSVRVSVRHARDETASASWPQPDWSDFKYDASALCLDMLDLLHKAKTDGRHIYGLGASTKANTILQWAGIGPDMITVILEVDQAKVGKFTVGSRIPIIAEYEFDPGDADNLYVVLARGYMDDMRKRYPSRLFATLLPPKLYPPVEIACIAEAAGA